MVIAVERLVFAAEDSTIGAWDLASRKDVGCVTCEYVTTSGAMFTFSERTKITFQSRFELMHPLVTQPNQHTPVNNILERMKSNPALIAVNSTYIAASLEASR